MEENKDFNAIVGKNLLKLRKNKKLTQMEVAEKFNYSDKSISKWEKGESMPSVEVLCELAAFYGVSLDALTSENEIVQPVEIKEKNKNEKKAKKEKTKTPRMFSTRLMVTLLSVGAVWLCATILFVMLKIFANTNYYMGFMWAGVLSLIVLIVFNGIWGRMRYLFPILTILLWLFLASLQVQIYLPTGINIWPVYFLGIPLQILIILWGALVKKPKGYYKEKKKKEQPTEVEIKKTEENSSN
ncbi:MAG: helix-turn-helix transcriptional regulator [Clostridia bacterium]|nr:helix-turn-helix transcriptional regulator [Clostridia bacterium]